MSDVSVIIPARDAADTIAATLEALGGQEFAGQLEVIVVDDGSRDETVAIASASPVVNRLIRLGGRGPSAARNAGVAAATSSALAFLDADCVPVPGWLSAGLDALGRVDYVQGMVVPDPEVHLGPFDRSLFVRRPSPLFESANLFVRRELFERLGGFEPWLLPRGGKELGEDVWLGWRARRAHARMSFCAEALVHHAVFRRSPIGYVKERARLRFFPALTARVPELRRDFLWCRLFHSSRSAAFDAAIAGAALALTRRRPLALTATAPYAWAVYRHGRGNGLRHLVKLTIAGVAADAVGAAALVVGSLRYRSPVL